VVPRLGSAVLVPGLGSTPVSLLPVAVRSTPVLVLAAALALPVVGTSPLESLALALASVVPAGLSLALWLTLVGWVAALALPESARPSSPQASVQERATSERWRMLQRYPAGRWPSIRDCTGPSRRNAR
jgi:hypothetical protein